MAIVDVAPLIDGNVYDPVIEIPGDTELLTEARLTNTAVALGNRIEYVRRLLPDFDQTPEARYTIRDDFIGFDYTTAGFGFIRTGSNVWVSGKTGNPSVSFTAGAAKNPGNLLAVLPGDAANNVFHFELVDDTAPLFTFLNWQHMTWVVRVDSPNTNLDAFVTFGLSDDADAAGSGNDFIRIIGQSNPGVPNWRLSLGKSGVFNTFDLTEPFVSGEYVVFRFKRLANTDVEVYVNEVVRHTIAAADLPLGSCTLYGFCSDNAADVAPSSYFFDFVFIRADSGARQGA